MTETGHTLSDDCQGEQPADDRLAFVFAYGSLLSMNLMKEACSSATFVIRASLPNYRIEFRVPSDTGTGGISGVFEAPGQLVLGVLYAVSKDDIPALDILESVDTGVYRKDRFLVLGEDGCWYTADVYRPAAPQTDQLKPAPFYIDYMIDGARAHGLGPRYVEQLEELRQSLT